MEQIPFFKTGQEIILEKDSKPTKSKLRGWRIGHYLLVDTPDISWTSQNAPIIGRFFGEATYYGFSTRVLGLLREVNLLALGYPDDIVETSSRKHLRFDTTIPVEIVNKDGSIDEKITGVIINISETGCQLVCAKPYNVDGKLYLRIHFPTGSHIENIGCILRSVAKVSDKFSYGVLFDIIDDDELIPLKEFINTVSEYNIVDHRR
ncbi:hypothetical protein MNBD_NITROSPINAE04-2377 [hydrothermal vent metagenome]|uniref:Uncharacterized protein n=1 Tax=hydrothermal vent metagenome TaxID=652676 RepID=A0A3B1CAS1_9ZZZZ